MIIDAMDILYSGKVDGFCLVSSDSGGLRRLRKCFQKLSDIGAVRGRRGVEVGIEQRPCTFADIQEGAHMPFGFG